MNSCASMLPVAMTTGRVETTPEWSRQGKVADSVHGLLIISRGVRVSGIPHQTFALRPATSNIDVGDYDKPHSNSINCFFKKWK
jgi:hypothetical protein